jgi:hypothetical protein
MLASKIIALENLKRSDHVSDEKTQLFFTSNYFTFMQLQKPLKKHLLFSSRNVMATVSANYGTISAYGTRIVDTKVLHRPVSMLSTHLHHGPTEHYKEGSNY